MKRQKLITLRKKKKLTQAYMAEHVEVARSTYNGYENGLFSPSIETAMKIKKILETSSDDIFELQ